MDRYLGQTNRLQRYLKFILTTRIETVVNSCGLAFFVSYRLVALFFQKSDRTL